MNYYEVQEVFKQMYPDKKIKFEFDEKCHRFHEISYTDGKPNIMHHVENRAVKVSVEGLESVYVPIAPHRECYTWQALRNMILGKDDVWIHENDLEAAKTSEDKAFQLAQMSGLSINQIKAKLGK